MSHYTKIKTQFLDKQVLVAMLRRRFADKVEVHEQAQTLYGVGGDARPETAEIIIRREHVGCAANDIGFKLQPDGSYEAIISEYDQRSNGYNREWMDRLTVDYTRDVVITYADAAGFQLGTQTQEKDGEHLSFYRLG